MNIVLPERLNRSTMYRLLKQVVNDFGEPIHEEYTFGLDSCRKFIEPIGVTFINNLVEWLSSKNIPVSFNYTNDINVLSNTQEPQRFLDDCGFFEKQIGKRIYSYSSLRPTTVPVQDISMSNFPAWLDNSFIPWIAETINKSSEELATFKVCLEEIFNNVRDHAEKDTSCVFAQHIPKNDCLIISIADIGVGIINHIKSKPEYSHFTDEEAIRNAVRNKFTTKSTPRNRGAGLDTLIHNVVMNADGKVYIYTNKGILVSRKENDKLIQEYREGQHFYPGTHIEIEIDIPNAANLFDFEEEDFSW